MVNIISQPDKLNLGITTNPNRYPEKYMEKTLSSYSSVSRFNDNTWIIDKINLDENRTTKQRSIYFGTYNNEGLLYETKEWVITLLLKRLKVKTINNMIGHIRNCDKPLENIESFSTLTEKDILKIYSHIFNNEKRAIKTNLESWFNMKNLIKSLDYQEQYFMMEKYIIPAFPDKKKVEEKYIPEEAITKLDIIFKTQEDIPLAYRTIYWTLRLNPHRIMEVLSMTTNCLKQINENSYVLSIPTFKQSGSFAQGTMKLIEIENKGIGAYYISLLKEQIEIVTQTYKPDTNYLFHTYSYQFSKKKGTDKKRYHISKSGKVKNISIDSVNYFLDKLCQHNKIKDDEGKSISITTHQFRHNAISDRMNSGIFRAIDITGLTKHHNTKMIEETYTHTSKNDLRKDSPVLFKGRIINTDNEKKLNQLLLKPYSKRIYNLGICSDVRNCFKDKSQCLRCDYMIPDVDNLDYYKSEMDDWKKKKESAKKIGNYSFLELCQDWVDSYAIVINKILHSLTYEEVDLIKEENKHE